MDNNVNTDLIRDHVDSFILRFLAKGDSYGYDIHKAISMATEGVYEIKQPTLYSCLKRLEKIGFILSYDGETSNGAQRKYYSITDKGKAFLEQDITQWEFSRTLLNRLLSDREFDLATAPKPFDPSELRPRTKRGVGLKATVEADSSPIPSDDAGNEECPIDGLVADAATSQEEPVYAPIPDEMTASVADHEDVLTFSKPQSDTESPMEIFGTKIQGEQLDMGSIPPEEEPSSPILQDFLADKRSTYDDDYRSTLNDMFASSSPTSSVEPEPLFDESKDVLSHGSAFNYGELKERAQANGYKLRPYSKASSSSYYSMNFIFSSRLKRDTLFILYFVMLVEILISYFVLDRFAGLGYVFYIVTASILLLVPIFGVIVYLLKPDKRIRADFDLKISLSGTSMLAINAFIVCMLLGFFAFNADITAPITMIKPMLYPALLLIDLPLYSIIYAILYNTRRYHLK